MCSLAGRAHTLIFLHIPRTGGTTLGSILRVLVEIAIWFGIVVVPLVAPPILIAALIVWAARRWVRRRERQQMP